MPRFAANLSWMFTEHAFLDRFAAASDAGFAGVELLFPYDHAPGDLASAARRAGVELVLFNLWPGDWAAGQRGLAAQPGGLEAVLASVGRALPFAREAGTTRLHLMAGIAPRDAASRAAYVTAVRHVADRLWPHGIATLIEPINRHDMPGYFLNDTDQALALLAEIDHEGAALQFDLYHHRMTHGDVTGALDRVLPHAAHLQIAGLPGRHEPDTGDPDYPTIFAALDRAGYDGWVGCEYRPRSDTRQGLGWFRRAIAAG